MITMNMNNIKNNVESIVANIWVMKDTKEDTRGYTKPRSWHDQESKRSLPPSRFSLARYALEYGESLRMIRVSWSLEWLGFDALGVLGAGIYRGVLSILSPRIKPTWKNGIDANPKAVENWRRKEGVIGGLLSFHLGLEQLKERTIKSNTMSQVLCSTIILEFL